MSVSECEFISRCQNEQYGKQSLTVFILVLRRAM
jgi:hypothetical protein